LPQYYIRSADKRKEEEMLRETRIFLGVFIVAGFAMKIIAEFAHEVLGHGLFVLLFGGEITGLYVSVLWPYDFSYINWSLPADVTSGQLAWIYAGGILACLSACFLAQVFLHAWRGIKWYYALIFFWFAFWTFVNSAGYLIIGGLTPFGDIYELIRLGVLTSIVALAAGLLVFLLGFLSLSQVLRKLLTGLVTLRNASLGVTVFWFIIPALVMVMLANPERGVQMTYIPLAFIPVVLSFAFEHLFVLSKQKTNKHPDKVA
jgi:hypothetical protein